MSLHSIPCWQVRCDWPSCGASPADVSEFAGWGEESTAISEAEEMDWWTTADAAQHYCPEHPVAWASDADHVRGMPGPFLLIHDGDGPQPHITDGHVTYCQEVPREFLD